MSVLVIKIFLFLLFSADIRELPVFVDLASISAGENNMDIDKVCDFRDAVLASSSIIYDLIETSGFSELMDAIEKLNRSIENDQNLLQKLVHSV